MKVLFQRFSQASPKTYQHYGGSGLGLWISRELCELQGGQIGVSSRDGKTTFTFFVRAKRWVPPPDQTHRPPLPRFSSASASPMVFNRRGSVHPKDAGSGAEKQLIRITSLTEHDESSRNNESLLSLKAHTSNNEPQQLHVLIVEDNLINQKVMSQQLRYVLQA